MFSVVLAISSVLMIVLVLMHKGRGGGLSDMFGGGVSSSLGGSSVAERNLDRITVGIAVVWVVCIFALGLLLKVSNSWQQVLSGAAVSAQAPWVRQSVARPPRGSS